MRVSISGAALALVLAAALPGTAGAQGGDNAVPYDGLAFDDVKHRRWYARFWTGECRDLSLFVCFPGKPYWHETMRKLAGAVAPERRAALRERLFALGRRIGHEWAKENDIRKISTDHIRAWYRELEKSGDPEPAIARIESEATRLLAGR
jgi:hypothetical protein